MARTYLGASQSVDAATTSATVWTDCAVLSFTPVANGTYYFIWSGEFGGDVITTDVQFRVFDGTTAYDTGNIEAKDNVPPEYYSQGGIFRIVFGATPAAQNIRVQIKSELAGNNVRGRNAEIVAILGIATDQWIETAANAAPANGVVVVQTLTFTPPSTKDYILLGSANLLVNATTTGMRLHIYDAAAAVASTNYFSVSDATGKQNLLCVDYEPAQTATSKSFTLRTQTTATGNACINRRLLALDVTGENVFYDERRAGTATTLATYADASSFTFTAAQNVEHLAIGCGSLTSNSLTVSGYANMMLDGVQFAETVCEASSTGTNDNVMGRVGIKLQTLATGSRIIKSQAKAETAGTTINAGETTFLVWQIASAPTNVTGTMGAPETADTLAATGTVQWIGPLATIETVDVLAATGSVRWSGPLATTEAADVLAATGSVRWAATLAAPETADAAVFNGAVGWIGALATSEAPDIAALTGSVFTPITGTFGTIEAPDVAAFTGSMVTPATGTLGVIETADAAAFIGAAAWIAGLAVSEATDTASLTGAVRWAATLATSEAPDIAALSGGVRWAATLATSEAADIAAFSGGVSWIGALTASEGADTAAMAGGVRWVATLTAAEAADAGAFLGAVRWTAALAVSEAPDVAALSGGIFGAGTLGAIEPPDAAAFTGQQVSTGTLATTEAADSYAGTGTAAGAGIGGNLDVREPSDGAVFFGQVTGVVGALGVTEPADTAGAAGQIRWTATLATTEAADAASITGATRWPAALAVSEAPDVAAMTGELLGGGALSVSEAPDVAAFVGELSYSGILATREAADSASIAGELIIAGDLVTREAPDRSEFEEAPVNIEESAGHILRSPTARVRELVGTPSPVLQNQERRTRSLASDNQRVRLLKYPIPRPRDLVNTFRQRIREPERRRARVLVRG